MDCVPQAPTAMGVPGSPLLALSDETTGSHFMQWDICGLSEETFAVHSVFSFPWPTRVSLNPHYLPHGWQLTRGGGGPKIFTKHKASLR